MAALIKTKQAFILIICFLLTSLVIYVEPKANTAQKVSPLAEAIVEVTDWHNKGYVPLEEPIVQALMLDDHLNHNFGRNDQHLMLYVGYYLKSKNVGAAHSPLVCFPGQGWLLSDFRGKTISTGAGEIKLMTIVASTPERKMLLMYWFQAFDRTSPGTFLQKINLIRSKYIHRREDNAFVRVTVPLDTLSVDKAHAVGEEFIRSFYPIFLEHVRENNS
jgi:EpsI family protein